MDLEFARKFATQWQDGWNSHDLDRILAHYHEDVAFSSPMIARFTGDASGTVRGKQELRAYWARGLELIPDLEFEVMDVRAGVDTLVIDYRNQIGGRVYEVLTFRDGLVSAGLGAYGETLAR
ncbi:nuclear transport factor 2 family protein [Streptomyces poriferorum]|uniref:nuclear transport factor 2 family protein n=1 Tax=Streptomyces TaxID=1883 RepID=UPI00273D160A|nr:MULTISPECIES: nuclear transport factor 2 family protein [unclassified Streptomyces]WLQ47675.1 nuclear transport factor 2 family protein [Streptomyces sp. Alt1]WSI62496.1 nuclear transport factor 2 family protein [Streptomyces sp. NBC_01336]